MTPFLLVVINRLATFIDVYTQLSLYSAGVYILKLFTNSGTIYCDALALIDCLNQHSHCEEIRNSVTIIIHRLFDRPAANNTIIDKTIYTVGLLCFRANF